MAKSKNNVLTHGLSGKIGDLLVFRQFAGQTFVSKAPKKPETESEKQKATRKRFQQAMAYAKAAMTDESLKNAYQAKTRKGLTAYNVAVADFLNAPKIETIDLSGYTGQPADVIRITVWDDFRVKEVTVTITHADGSVLESGHAQPDGSGSVWIYTAGRTNDNPDGGRITVSASDMPGNITEEGKDL